MGKPRFQKKILLINREFQLRHARAAAAVGFVSTLLTAAIILYPLYVFEILRVPKFLPLPVLGTMVLAVLVNITMVGFLGISVTHRVAGPMYSLLREFRKLQMGRLDAFLRVRKDDEFKFVVRNFNEAVENLRAATIEEIGVVKDLIKKSNSEDPKDREYLKAGLKRLEERFSDKLRMQGET